MFHEAWRVEHDSVLSAGIMKWNYDSSLTVYENEGHFVYSVWHPKNFMYTFKVSMCVFKFVTGQFAQMLQSYCIGTDCLSVNTGPLFAEWSEWIRLKSFIII